MKHIYALILAISTVLSQKSSTDHYAFNFHISATRNITISFQNNLAQGENIKSVLEKSLFKYSPTDISSLMLVNVSTREIFENSCFNAFKKLEKLYIQDGQISNFPESTFEGLGAIEELRLVNIEMINVSANLFKLIPSLNELWLDKNHLEDFPPGVFNLVSLYDIHLSWNKIANLQKGVFNFSQTKTTRIFLDHNSIKALEEGVFLGSLEGLDLSYNDIGKIDTNTFQDLPDLWELYMTATFNDKVDNLPKELFSKSINLNTIDISQNHLKSLEAGIFHNLEKLERLDLSSNQLKNFGEEIFKDNTHLKYLNLSKNSLQSLSQNIFMNLFNLIELDLSHNDLKHLDTKTFMKLTSLSDLYITHNEVNLDAGDGFSILQHCMNLKNIYARNNGISIVFTDWRTSSKLKILDLTFNPLQLQRNMTSEFLYFFYFTSDNSTNVKLGVRDVPSIGIQKRDHIPLPMDRDISCDRTRSCSCMLLFKGNTLILECKSFDENKLAKWPYYIIDDDDYKNHSVEIILSNCNIKALYPVSKYMEEVKDRVTKLALSNNHLTNLNDLDTLNLPALRILELNGNQFLRLSYPAIAFLKHLPKLEVVTLHENPWTCDCLMQDFYDYVKNDGQLIHNRNELTCSNICNRSIVSLDNYRDFCPIEFSDVFKYVMPLVLLAVTLLISMYYFYTYEKEIKVWIFSKHYLRFLVTEKELDRHLPFDAFVSYATPDEWFVVEELQPELECGERSYKLCIHQRDWHAGDYIPTQIHRSVEQSRRTIIVLSPSFLNSFWGKKEFQAAYMKSMKERCPRILIILLKDIGDVNDLDDEMRAYISTNTYLDWKDPKFWQKLKYALPHTHRIRCKRTQEELLIP